MESKRCLLIYFGNGYSEKEHSYNHEYEYSVDMRDTRQNHIKNINQPLIDLGYCVDVALVTNKHKYYDEFKKEYDAIDIQYEDLISNDEDILFNFYVLKTPEMYGPGSMKSGGRFVKIRDRLPEYDLYVFVRTDTIFKMSLNDLKVDYEKINYLWPETDYRFFTEERENFMNQFGTDRVFWNSYNRVNGNILNVVSKKYINVFLTYFWLDHMSLSLMLRDLYPLITYEKDINLMCGEDTCYVSDVRVCDNPVYTFNKKIIY